MRLRFNRSVPILNTNILKRKISDNICSEIIKVHQKKEKIRSFSATSVTINVLKGIH